MHAFRAIYARRIVLTDGFSFSRDDAALQENLHQMFMQQNCLLHRSASTTHSCWPWQPLSKGVNNLTVAL